MLEEDAIASGQFLAVGEMAARCAVDIGRQTALAKALRDMPVGSSTASLHQVGKDFRVVSTISASAISQLPPEYR